MKQSYLAAAIMMTFAASAAQAGSVASQFFSGFQQLSDNSAEVQSFDGNNNGLLDAGDILSGIFTIETIEKGGTTHAIGAGTSHNEMTGLFEAMVTSVVPTQTYFDGTSWLAVPGSHYLYTFAPTAAFQATYGVGAMIATFDDPAKDYTRIGCATVAGCMATASGGTPFMVLGFENASNFWVADAVTNNIQTIGAVAAPGNGGTFNAGLNILSQGPAASSLVFNSVPCVLQATVPTFGIPGVMQSYAQVPVANVSVDVCGSGSLLGTGGVNTPFNSFDNVDFTVDASQIPEPATLGLLGAGLLGMSMSLRRRRA